MPKHLLLPRVWGRGRMKFAPWVLLYKKQLKFDRHSLVFDKALTTFKESKVKWLPSDFLPLTKSQIWAGPTMQINLSVHKYLASLKSRSALQILWSARSAGIEHRTKLGNARSRGVPELGVKLPVIRKYPPGRGSMPFMWFLPSFPTVYDIENFRKSTSPTPRLWSSSTSTARNVISTGLTLAWPLSGDGNASTICCHWISYKFVDITSLCIFIVQAQRWHQ